ncbi:hypothetical protein RNQ65_23295, partial [Escherichia coli]|nr:hypothetical protein [Escherichia coli]
AGNVATPRDQCNQHLACQPRERVVALECHSICKLIFTPRPSRCAYEITPDEQKEPVAAIAPSLSTSTQTRVSASSCKVEFRHGNMTLENPSPELLTVLIRELTGRGR